MQSPFENDPFVLMYAAFHNLCPDKNPRCCWAGWISDDETKDDTLGVTECDDDGAIWIVIRTDLTVKNALEIFAHELAHVMAGLDADHGEAWQTALDAIETEYNRICDEMFGEEDDNAE